MVAKSVFQNRLLPLEYVALGRFVVDPEYPQRDFHSPFTSGSLPSSRFTQQDFQELLLRNQATNIGTQLTELVKLFHDVQKEMGTYVNTTIAATYELHQWDQVFRAACAKLETRKWLESAIEDDKDVHFIVGYHTFIDPSVAELTKSRKSDGVDLQLPISTVVAANAPGLTLGTVLDPSVSGTRAHAIENVTTFETTGEAVYAVQYCKVKFKWYSSRKIETSSLGDIRWKIHWGGVRSETEELEDDVVEVELVEDMNIGDEIL